MLPRADQRKSSITLSIKHQTSSPLASHPPLPSSLSPDFSQTDSLITTRRREGSGEVTGGLCVHMLLVCACLWVGKRLPSARSRNQVLHSNSSPCDEISLRLIKVNSQPRCNVGATVSFPSPSSSLTHLPSFL